MPPGQVNLVNPFQLNFRGAHFSTRRPGTRGRRVGPAQWLLPLPDPDGRGVDDEPELAEPVREAKVRPGPGRGGRYGVGIHQ